MEMFRLVIASISAKINSVDPFVREKVKHNGTKQLPK